MRKIELLSPAKDLTIGIAAIHNGADAVYIGAPAFGARKSAANSIEDIAKLVNYAHRFYCRVFVTLNTVLYDSELKEAEQMIRRLYEIGADALIIQDMGILKLDIPPIALHASTQMHNYDPEKIIFLDRLGFERIVLARELSLEQIREIRQQVKAELEVFIHGALCVSLSGQCYLSHYMSGRSANRGECMQACRMKWSVKDSDGKYILQDKYVLSLKDLNMSAHIKDLIDVGVDSFKIEGRLKDEKYVSNITNHYHSLIETLLKSENREVCRVGSGEIQSGFPADPERSFNRGYCDYFAVGRSSGLVNMETPKSIGKFIGTAGQVKGNRLWITGGEAVHNGDGLCYSENGEWKGIRVNKAEGEVAECNEILTVRPGTRLYRNYDHRFAVQLEKNHSFRKIGVCIKAVASAGHLKLYAEDEDGVNVFLEPQECFELARGEGQRERLIQQLKKCGESDFFCQDVLYEGEALFLPAAVINNYRRQLLENLSVEREKYREVLSMKKLAPGVNWREKVDWKGNVNNKAAALFYREHGAVDVEPGFETGNEREGRELMRTRYCILYELGYCRKQGKDKKLHFPLYICNAKYCFRLDFDCQACFMKIIS